jgi:Na+-translocating ferredoxin:NAD+ oxidoreductase subunit D
MLLPAVTPWWVVITGTFLAIVIGKQIYGGLGRQPFQPGGRGICHTDPVLAGFILITMPPWSIMFAFDPAYPMAAAKFQGAAAAENFSITGMLLGQQVGGIGTGFGLGLIIGGHLPHCKRFYPLGNHGFFPGWHHRDGISVQSEQSGTLCRARFHLFSGMSLIGAIFLATEDSSSPVNFFPMLIYGALGGVLTVLIRNMGVHVDGVIFATAHHKPGKSDSR